MHQKLGIRCVYYMQLIDKAGLANPGRDCREQSLTAVIHEEVVDTSAYIVNVATQTRGRPCHSHGSKVLSLT